MNATVQAVLNRLRADGSFVSGQGLSQDLGITRAAVWKAVQKLLSLGYDVEAVRRRGYRLRDSGKEDLGAELDGRLTTRFLGRESIFLAETGSTNSLAKEYAFKNARHGLLIVADRQTQGRGRMQRPWHSPAGRNLYLSVLLRPEVAPPRVPQLAIVVAIALCEALAECLPEVPVRIKWPNDLWIGDRKLCGILCEMEAEMMVVHHVIVGVGLNVNMTERDFLPELRPTGTSLRLEAGREVSRAQILAAFLNRLEPLLERWNEADDLAPFLAAYNQRSLLHGRQIRVEQHRQTLVGRAVGISPLGELLLESDGGVLRIHSGDAHIQRDSITGS
jgi:BirA family biotin operon repressor/biotin-[acetyl-CoA-carboxylase] ligase